MPRAKTSDDPKELYDRVNANDVVVGKVARAEAHSKGIFHRAAHVWLFDGKGRLFLQQRSATKDTNPLKWGSSVGGHLDLGESYESAVLREAKEELGLNIGVGDLVFVQKFKPSADTNWEFVKLYFVAYDGKLHGRIRLNKKESAGGKFVGVEEVGRKIALNRGSFTPDFMLFFGWARKAGVLPRNVRAALSAGDD